MKERRERLDLKCDLSQPTLSLVQAAWKRAELSPGAQNQPNALAELVPLWVQLPAHTRPHLSLKEFLCELWGMSHVRHQAVS